MMARGPRQEVGGVGAAAGRYGIGGSEAMTLQMLREIFPEMSDDQIYAMWRKQQEPAQVPPERNTGLAGDLSSRGDIYDANSFTLYQTREEALEASAQAEELRALGLGPTGIPLGVRGTGAELDAGKFDRLLEATDRIYAEQNLGRMQEFEIPTLMREYLEPRVDPATGQLVRNTPAFRAAMKDLQVPERLIEEIITQATGETLGTEALAALPSGPVLADRAGPDGLWTEALGPYGLGALDPFRDTTVPGDRAMGAVRPLPSGTTVPLDREAQRADLEDRWALGNMSPEVFQAEALRLGFTAAEIQEMISEFADPKTTTADPKTTTAAITQLGADPQQVVAAEKDLDPYGQGDLAIFADDAAAAEYSLYGGEPLTPREQAFRGMDVGEQYSRFLSGLVGPHGSTGTVARGLANILGPVMVDRYYGDQQVSPFYQAMIAGRETPADEPAGSYYDFLQQRGARPFTRGELAQQLRDVVTARGLGEGIDPTGRQAALLGSFSDPGDQFRLFQDYMEQSVAPSGRRAAGQAAQNLYTRFRNMQPENQQFLALMQQQGRF